LEKRGEVLANTLTVRYNGEDYGIRPVEESIVRLFHDMGRSGYPSAYVYNTGQWHKYPELLVDCFRLSEGGRYTACNQLLDFGRNELTENRFFGHDVPRVRLFALIVSEYDRTRRRTENGGLVFQGIVFGYLTDDRPHLDLITDKVRTGSARQRRFGEVDGHYGIGLELSAEVKDLTISEGNVGSEFGDFVAQVAGNRILGIAFAASFTPDAEAELGKVGVAPFSQDNLLASVFLWDWQKQDRAVHGVLHYLAHIEQNPDATSRLLAFIAQHDPSHPSLAHIIPSPVIPSPEEASAQSG